MQREEDSCANNILRKTNKNVLNFILTPSAKPLNLK